MYLFVFGNPLAGMAQDIQTNTLVVAPRAAPGESMPVTVRLSNFGLNQRADVTITYAVLDSLDHILVSENETVAVETTAVYARNILLPATLIPGNYTLKVTASYLGQQVPAGSSYQFKVERKIAGIFSSDLFNYGAVALAGIVLALGLTWLFKRPRAIERPSPHSSKIPRKGRVYYEIIAGVIQEMRLHEGDAALSLARAVSGLKLDEEGNIRTIAGDPALIVASLVSQYEKVFGKRMNFCFGKNA